MFQHFGDKDKIEGARFEWNMFDACTDGVLSYVPQWNVGKIHAHNNIPVDDIGQNAVSTPNV